MPYYTTLRELGRGAMGVVYQARHNLTGQMVALKLIMPETATTRAAIDRFQREMSVISQLRHPNIVEWYEQGMTPRPVLVRHGVRRRHQPRDPGQGRTRPLSRQAGLPARPPDAQGPRQAHQHGFVHRDIKPENILIANTPDGPTVKISDFGLAKSFRGVGLSGLTFSGEMRGTVPFMPPEQMLDFKTVTPLADLYATAATLYYLLTCQYVYDEPAGGGDLIRMLLEEPSDPHPDPPARRRRRPWPTSSKNASPATPRSATPTPPRCARPSSRSADTAALQVAARALLAPTGPARLRARSPASGTRGCRSLARGPRAIDQEDPRGVVEHPVRIALDPHVPGRDDLVHLFGGGAGQEVPARAVGLPELGIVACRTCGRVALGVERDRHEFDRFPPELGVLELLLHAASACVVSGQTPLHVV